MARLGELLVAARLLTEEEVERALRAQVLWGARLGTNLLELGLIDLDNLSRALGRQHNLPAALARHFDRADPELQRRIDPELAERWSFVPLLRVGPQARIAIAAMDPLDPAARAEIARALAVAPRELVVSVAAEQRVRYQLERVYGIERSARYLRPRGPSATFPVLGEVPVPIDSDPSISVPLAGDDEPSDAIPEPIGESASPEIVEEIAAQIDAAIASATSAPNDEPSGERRSYVRTLADTQPPPGALGRIAIRKVMSTRLPTVEPDRPCETLHEATRGIRRASRRDRVAELAIEAIAQFATECDAAMLMVVRGGAAIGWKWFCRSGATPPELAVPMDQPGLVPRVVATSLTARASADELDAIDMLLLRALGGRADGHLVVVPVAIAGQVMCAVAAVTSSDAPLPVVEAVAGAAGAAFARLIRDASR